MKAQLQTNKGKLIVDIPVINRYKVVANTATTSADWTQFWTWLRYEMRIDYNVNQKVIGCNAFNLSKIKKQWSSKFYFDK